MSCVSCLCGSVHTRLICVAVCTHVSFVWQCAHTSHLCGSVHTRLICVAVCTPRLICVRVCAHILFSVAAQSAGAKYPKEQLDEIFSVVEALYQSGCVMGVANKFFDLVEDSAAFRPVSTMLRVECVTRVRVHACGVRVHGVCYV